MTALNPEAKMPDPQVQTPVDTNMSQSNVDSNLSQKKIESTDENKQPLLADGSANEDPNWRAFREARKRDRAEREAAERRAAEKEQEAAALKAAMEAAFAKGAPSPQAYQQYYGIAGADHYQEETEEQKIERKVNEIIAKKEQDYHRAEQERESKEWPDRLKKNIPDVWAVCSQENLDYLDYHYPEVSRPLQRLSEGYDKWSDIYHAVKKFIPNHSSAKKEAVRAEINSNKPRSMSSSGPSPTGDKGRETWQEAESRRAENWARMQRTMKGV